MKLKKNSSEQKLRGAYYTPTELANSIVGLLASAEIKSILEPSCGDGAFIDSLSRVGVLEKVESVQAVEIDAEEAQKVGDRYALSPHVEIYNEDFFDFYDKVAMNSTYDLILGNPPYIRYQYLTDHQRELQSQILTVNGMKSNKLINAWVAFLVACVQLLSENGKIAFVIPAEILQVAYAEDLRHYLSDHFAKITLIAFEQLVFPDIEQEIVVFIGEKGNAEKGIRIIEVENIDDFKRIKLEQKDFQKMQHGKEKWTKYFLTSAEMNLVHVLRADKRFSKFTEYGIINVGITTGNNNYFSITEETTNKYGLGDSTLPLIGRSSHAHGIYFSADEWTLNKAAGKRARLICFPDIPFEDYSEGYKEYIAFGEDSGVDLGYKCSIRGRWYRVPSVWVPDAFFLRRSNLYPKFVLNRCGAVSTDTMHRMKFNKEVDPENVLLSYYNSISFAFTEICGRSYGGGVLEILPGEMGDILLPKIDNLSIDIRTSLLNQVDSIVRQGKNIELALDLIDEELLVGQLGIKFEVCSACRKVWKKLQNRRLNRS